MEAYARYGPALLRKARRILQNEEDARDVVQVVFAELIQRREQEVSLSYLFRAVTTRCCSLLRDEANRRRLLELQAEALRGPVRTLLDERTITLDLLTRAARELESDALALIIYRYLDDMTLEEISALVGSTRKTVKKRLDAAARVCRRLIDEHGGPHV